MNLCVHETPRLRACLCTCIGLVDHLLAVPCQRSQRLSSYDAVEIKGAWTVWLCASKKDTDFPS